MDDKVKLKSNKVSKTTLVLGLLVVALLAVSIGLLVAYLNAKAANDKEEVLPGTNETITEDASLTSTESSEPPADYRLSSDILPTHYFLLIEPDHANGKFKGNVSIEISINEETSIIKLHSFLLEITEKYLYDSNDKPIPIDGSYDVATQFYKLDAKQQKLKGNYKINLIFSGSLEGKLIGFHKTSYVNSITKQKSELSSTKFEPTYARQAFPCFDEPSFKATFDIKVIHDAKLGAISNMPSTSTIKVDATRNETSFETSVKMSTYLVAFAISDFLHKYDHTKRGKEVRLFARPDQINNTKYALSIARRVLEHYEDYFGSDFPLPKLDLIALPVFVSGAMENWGLITFRESILLFDENSSSETQKQRIVQVIAHELAHMWFGNLVTMKWWNDLWLNEGFASYIQYKGTDFAEPSWDYETEFLVKDLQPVIKLDALTSSHPIIQEVNNPDEITELFDAISYDKGSSVLRMLEATIGSNAFKDGIRSYMKKYEYANAETNDFWNSLSEFVKDQLDGLTVKEFMENWTRKKGLPMLTIERSAGSSKIDVTQERFLLDSEIASQQNDEQEPEDLSVIWNVPLSYLTQDNKNGKFILKNKKSTFDLKENSPSTMDKWIKFNVNQTGYYLVNYPAEDWKLLTDALLNKYESFTPADRSSLLFDSLMLAQNGKLDYETALDLTFYLREETHNVPWTTAASLLLRLSILLSNSKAEALIHEHINYLTKPLYGKLGWEFKGMRVEDIQSKFLRTQILGLACFSGNSECLSEASSRLSALINSKTPIAAELRSTVYEYGMQEIGKSKEWQFMMSKYLSESDPTEKNRLLLGLSSVRDPQLLRKLLTASMDEQQINSQDFFTLINYISGNTIGSQLVWNFIRTNWEAIVKRFTINDRRLGSVITSATSKFTTELQLKEMQEFFNKYPDAGASKNARKQALERVRSSISWSEKYNQEIEVWLQNNTASSQPWKDWRLSSLIRPTEYKVNWEIDVDGGKFNGDVNITVETQVAVDYFILHAYNDMTVTEAQAYRSSGMVKMNHATQKAFHYSPNEYLVIPLKQQAYPGRYSLYLKFESKLIETLVGLYKSNYKMNGNTHSIATTQFESTYARNAFPCFDEPQFKSNFTISIKNALKYTAISNMPEVNVENDVSSKTTHFATSVPMTTYVVALIVSEFTCDKANNKFSDVSIRICGPGDQIKKLEYAKSMTPRILNYFDKDYFKVNYPLPKLDLASIPDFRFGAMENWGLVTFREMYLLYDKDESTTSNKMTICSIIAHELAHMWFGNLVTMQWWEDIWLNEGFAQFMSYKAVDAVAPEWKWMDYFVIGEMSRVLAEDSTPKTHPIVNSIHNVDDIQSMFNAIIYGKGACVIRMLELALVKENFQKGIQNYLRFHKYGNTVNRDLWTELSNAHPDRLNVASMMDTWINKKGFPVITVERVAPSNETIDETDDSSNKTNLFKLKQERFFKDSKTSKSDYLWNIPLTYCITLDCEKYEVKFFSKSTETYEIKSSLEYDLVKFNAKQAGLYIINYPLDDWKNWITQLINSSEVVETMTPSDKANLISDSFYLARSGRLSYEIPLHLSEYLINEDDFTPWTIARSMISHIKNLVYTDFKSAMNHYMQGLVSKQYTKLGWDEVETESDLNKRLRPLIIELACEYGSNECLEEASKRFKDFENDSTKKGNPNVRSAMVKYGLQMNDDDKYVDFLWKMFNEAVSAAEKSQYLTGLASAKKPEAIDNFLAKTLNRDAVRSQDFFTALRFVADNPYGIERVWKFYQDNYEKIAEEFSVNDANVNSIVRSFCTHFTTEAKKKEVLAFFKKYPNAGAGQNGRDQALETLDGNMKWISSYKNKVGEWITKKCPKDICPWSVYRLNEKVIPINYHLTLQPNITHDTFQGDVIIEVDVKQESLSHFIVHADSRLEITESKVMDSQDKVIDIDPAFRYEPLEFWVVPLKQPLTATGTYKLAFTFNGILTGRLTGLYKSTYKNKDNETIGLAATQFQSTHARKAFPSFDEPSFRPTFELTVIHDANTTAISNMPETKSTQEENSPFKVTKFDKTVNMVSYLLALVVSDFECKTRNFIITDKEKWFRVCASPEKSYKLNYTLDIGIGILKYFADDYFKVEFPLPKIDQIAIPDFSAGAMENWGLVTYRETAMLYDEMEETTANKMSICAVNAHELAHMWHGNLVTMKWWSDLWLNEGFASFMEYKAVDAVEPTWNFYDWFPVNDFSRAFEADSLNSSQPIVRKVETPAQMAYISAIVYSKGASVLRMLEFFMGRENFQHGIQNYLRNHTFGNTLTPDLWEKLNEVMPDEIAAAGIDVGQIMDGFVSKAGYPYLNVIQDGDKITVTQERFLQTGQKWDQDDTWIVPLSYYKSFTNSPSNYAIEYIKSKESSFNLKLDPGTKLVKFNVEQSGFYIVNYDLKQWSALSDALMNDQSIRNAMKASDRSNLISDSFLLAQAEKLSYTIPLEMSKYLKHETHPVPWIIANNMLSYLSVRLRTTEYKEKYKSYLKSLTNDLYSSLTWDETNDDDNRRRLRVTVVNIACSTGNENCLSAAGSEFKKWKDGEKLRPNMKINVLNFGIRNSKNVDDWNHMWQMYLKSNSSQEKRDYLQALSYTKDMNLLKKLLEYTQDDRLVRSLDYYSALYNIASNPDGMKMVWKFYRDNFAMLTRRLTYTELYTLGQSIVRFFTTEDMIKEIKEFYSSYADNQLMRSGQMASLLEKAEMNVKWIGKYLQVVGDWLNKNVS